MIKRFDLRIPTDLHKRLVAIAKAENRSLNGQIISMLQFDLEVRNAVLEDEKFTRQFTEGKKVGR